jgi:hypothetical protein
MDGPISGDHSMGIWAAIRAFHASIIALPSSRIASLLLRCFFGFLAAPFFRDLFQFPAAGAVGHRRIAPQLLPRVQPLGIVEATVQTAINCVTWRRWRTDWTAAPVHD